jgi:hypothetical protein
MREEIRVRKEKFAGKGAEGVEGVEGVEAGS